MTVYARLQVRYEQIFDSLRVTLTVKDEDRWKPMRKCAEDRLQLTAARREHARTQASHWDEAQKTKRELEVSLVCFR